MPREGGRYLYIPDQEFGVTRDQVSIRANDILSPVQAEPGLWYRHS